MTINVLQLNAVFKSVLLVLMWILINALNVRTDIIVVIALEDAFKISAMLRLDVSFVTVLAILVIHVRRISPS